MGSGKKKGNYDQLYNLQKEMSQILSDFNQTRHHMQTLRRSLEVPLDVFETDEEILIRAELPGIPKEDIQLYMLRDVLVIEGEKKLLYRSNAGGFLNVELQTGHFKRDIEIGKSINVQTIKTELKNGVLYINLEKISDRRGRRKMIEIK